MGGSPRRFKSGLNERLTKLLGFIGVPLIGTAAAIGLVLFFVCAIYTHLLARDYSPQFGLAIGFLLLNVAALVLDLGLVLRGCLS